MGLRPRARARSSVTRTGLTPDTTGLTTFARAAGSLLSKQIFPFLQLLFR